MPVSQIACRMSWPVALRQVARLAPEVLLAGAGMRTNDNGFDPGAALARAQADELDHTGKWRVVRHRQPLLALGDGLAAHHFLADADDGPRHLADVLRQRHRDPRRKRQAPDRAGRGQLARGRMHPALEGLAAKIGKQFHFINLFATEDTEAGKTRDGLSP
jgi:hypothetical protein